MATKKVTKVPVKKVAPKKVVAKKETKSDNSNKLPKEGLSDKWEPISMKDFIEDMKSIKSAYEKASIEENKKLALESRITFDFPIARGKSVIVLRGNEDLLIEGGIILPESSDDVKMRGTVMSVGPDVQEIFIDHTGVARPLRPKDRVLFNSYANLNIIHKSNNYLVMSELDIYAVLPKGVALANEKHKSRKGVKINWEG